MNDYQIDYIVSIFVSAIIGGICAWLTKFPIIDMVIYILLCITLYENLKHNYGGE